MVRDCPTSFQPERKGNVKSRNNSSVDIRFLTKTADIRNFSQNIRSDVKTSEVATLLANCLCSSNFWSNPRLTARVLGCRNSYTIFKLSCRGTPLKGFLRTFSCSINILMFLDLSWTHPPPLSFLPEFTS